MYNYLNERLNFATKEMMKNIETENEIKFNILQGIKEELKMDRLETIDQIKAIEYRIKETKQAINYLKTKIGMTKVTIDIKQHDNFGSKNQTIFSNNIINAIMLGALEAQLEADKLDLNKLVLKIYSEVLEK